jgi:hypothetical protein
VEKIGQPCPPRPLVGVEVRATTGPAGQTVASALTDGTGHYALTLAPGTYTLQVTANALYPRCPPTRVTVPAAAPVAVDIGCDTGIR